MTDEPRDPRDVWGDELPFDILAGFDAGDVDDRVGVLNSVREATYHEPMAKQNAIRILAALGFDRDTVATAVGVTVADVERLASKEVDRIADATVEALDEMETDE